MLTPELVLVLVFAPVLVLHCVPVGIAVDVACADIDEAGVDDDVTGGSDGVRVAWVGGGGAADPVVSAPAAAGIRTP
jgi:hypothetical protein